MAQGTSIGQLFFTTGISFDGFKRDAKQGQSALSGLFNPAIIGSAALGASLIKLGSDALEFSKQYETAFAEVQTISQAARENADEMSAAILKMTTEIPVGAVDSTRALYQIVSAGFDGAEAMNVLEISAKAAVAGVTTTAVAADTLTTIINAYGLSAKDATNISDALFKTVELGKTTLSEIGSSFSQVASIAASYNITQNDVLAGLASITKQGASTGEAVTRLRGAIVSLAKEFGPAVFQGRTLGEAFQFARDAADESGKTYEEFFGRVEASTGILQLTGKNAIIFSESLDKINTSAGSTEAALGVMNDTLEAQETLLANNFKILKSQFGDVLSDLWKTILPGLNSELKVLADDTIPGYAKVLAVAANAVNLGLLFGGKAFTAEQFAPDIVQSLKKAERATEDFTQRTKTLSDESFQKEVENIQAQQAANIKAFNNLEDRKKKGFKFDEDALEEAKDRNLIFYQILESAEKRLASIREKTPTSGGGEGDEVIAPKVTISSIKKELKELQDEIEKASKEEAVEIEVKIRAKEDELKDFVTDINDRVRALQVKADGLTEISAEPMTEGFKLSKEQTKEFKKQSKVLAKMNGEWVKTAKLVQKVTNEQDDSTNNLGQMADDMFNIADVTGELAGLAANFDEELAKGLDTIGHMATGAANIAEGLTTGNITQGIAGGVQILSSLAGEIFGGDDETESFSESMDKFVLSLSSAQQALDRLSGRKVTAEITSIDDTLNKVAERIENLQGLRDMFTGDPLFGEFQSEIIAVNDLDAAIAELSNKIISGELEGAALTQAQKILDAYIELKDEIEAITKEITGVTGDELSDSLIEAFDLGKGAVEDWGKTAEDVIRNVITSQLKTQLLVKPIQDAIDKLTRGAAEDGLSVEEAKEFTDVVNALQSGYSDAFGALNDVFKEAGIDLSGATDAAESGLAGAIGRQITEDTAIELQGIWNRQLFETISHTAILNESNGYLSEIAVNTLRTAEACESLNEKITSDSSDRDTGNIL